MLVLARKVNEMIHIGDSIVIKVLAIHEGQVKIGIEAPEGIRIFRSEVLEHIKQQEAAAAAGNGGHQTK